MNQFVALVNGEERFLACPTRFIIPPLAERRSVKDGSYVKLGFQSMTEELPTERMWVLVTGPGVGLLSNTPVFMDKWLRKGERVQFEPEHVLDIIEPSPS